MSINHLLWKRRILPNADIAKLAIGADVRKAYEHIIQHRFNVHPSRKRSADTQIRKLGARIKTEFPTVAVECWISLSAKRSVPKSSTQNRVDSLRTRGVIALYDGRFAEALASFEEVHRLSSGPIADSHLALAYFYNGDVRRAEQLARDLSGSQSLSASTRGRASLASFLAAQGVHGEAEKLLRELEARESIDHHAAYSIGCAYAQLRNHAKALYWIKRAGSTGLACFPLFQKDSLLDKIRSDSGFQDFLNEMRENAEATKRRQSCARPAALIATQFGHPGATQPGSPRPISSSLHL